MTEEVQIQRRLAAVLSMDIVGYSRMSEADVEGTHRKWRAILDGIIAPAIADAAGHIIKGTGDGALVDFPSVSEAVRCAMRIQRETQAREQGEPPDRQIQLRMGINLGDVIVDGDDIYGDGVNIAARLEALAQPGEVVVSESAMQTGDRTGVRFVDLGMRRLKNISRPVRIYRATASDDASSTGGAERDDDMVTGVSVRPAIAVLPFREHPGAEAHLADGITEDIIAALAARRLFPVVPRNSAFAYKGRDVDARAVGQQLGARYVLEGTLRRADGRLRCTVQLVDADTMESVLAERYDVEPAEMFAAQEVLVREVVAGMWPELLKHERERAMQTPPQNATAYEMMQRGLWHHHRYTRDDSEQARRLFARALEIDPSYAQASARWAITLIHAGNSGWTDDRKALYREAVAHARNAVQIDPRDPTARYALGLAYHSNGHPEEAIAELREAIALAPNHAGAYANLAFVLNYLDRPEEALPLADQALRLSKHDPRRFMWMPARVISHYLARRYLPALAIARECLLAKPDYPITVRYLVATLGQLGRKEEARPILPLLARLDTNLAGTEAILTSVYVPSAIRHILDGLKKAGFD
ncbi:MAG: tetratricopeptide repeat protein [Acetobacteraceae bacterium]